MAKAIEQIDPRGGIKLTVGHVKLGLHGGKTGSLKQQIHDGDTIIGMAVGNISIRFLSVDTPEISFTLPGEKTFTPIDDEAGRWAAFLDNPFGADLPLSAGLKADLVARVGPGCAANHARHAKIARQRLIGQVEADMTDLGIAPENRDQFQFFMVFAYEVMDRYGRLLGYINCDQPDKTKRPPYYNARMLRDGLASPYFIWPNLDLFIKKISIRDAVFEPGSVTETVRRSDTLREARELTQHNRANHIGIFEAADPLRLQPFELRYLAGRRVPDRWVIDLRSNDNRLLHPEEYHAIPNIEDRLFIPSEYVPLFIDCGWRK